MLKARCKFGATWNGVHARLPLHDDAPVLERSARVCVADTCMQYTEMHTRGEARRGEGRQGRYLALMIAIMPNAISRQNLSVARATARVANRAKNSNELPARARKSAIMRGRARTMKREGHVGMEG